jgi:hypothetical protein
LIPTSLAALPVVRGAAVYSPVAFADDEADRTHGLLDGALLFLTSFKFLLPVLVMAMLVR